MCIKNIFFAALICVTWFTGLAQTAKIKGVIRSNQGSLESAAITIKSLGLITYSDSSGYFELKDVPMGVHTVHISMVGFKSTNKQITISSTNDYLLGTIYMISEEGMLEEVVITGTLKEVSISESPIPVEVYSAKHLQKGGATNLFESINMINGVQPQLNCSICNTGDIHINGMEGPYTMVTIDGMPIVSGLSTVYGLSGIPNSLLQRVEVVKGPASTLYGSEAVAGVINVITKNPSSAPRISADVSLSTQGESNTDIGLRYKINKTSALLGVNHFYFNTLIDKNKDGFTDVTLQHRTSIFNKYSFERKLSRVANLAFRYIYEDRWGGQTTWNKSFRGGDEVYGESIYTARYEVIGAYQLPINNQQITLQYSLNQHNQNSVYGTTSYIARQNVFFAQLIWRKNIHLNHDITVGTPVRYTYYDDNTTATQSISTVNTPSKTWLPGIFAQHEWGIGKQSTLLTGVRYDYNSIHGHVWSPRMALKKTMKNKDILRLSVGNGFRVVNLFTEDHAALTGARSVQIVGGLQPERSWNGTINYFQIFAFSKNSISIDHSLFYTFFTNRIIADYLTDPNKIIYSNLNGDAISRGYSVNIDFMLSSGIKLVVGGTYLDVFSTQKDTNVVFQKIPQLFAPKISGTYALTIPISKTGISIDYTGRVYSPMHLPVVVNDYRSDMSPWFIIHNIQVTKKVKQWEIYAGIKNLFDFRPSDPLLRPFDPFDKNIDVNNPNGYTFDTTYIYASLQGIRGMFGVRWMLK